MLKVTSAQLKGFAVEVMKAGLVPFIKGSPGIGKSDITCSIAEDLNAKVIDLRLSQSDPTDMNGFPSINRTTDKAQYIPFDTFPVVGDSLPLDSDGNKMNGWVLFLDELSSAPLSVQAAAYKLILDRKVGQYTLHPNVAIVAAGNLSTDKAIVTRMGTAMQSRLAHFNLVCEGQSIDDWLDWAVRNHVDHRIVSYINYKKDDLFRFDPNHNEDTFPCPRTWTFASKLIIGKESLGLPNLPLVGSVVGEGAARAFIGFTDIYDSLPPIDKMLSDPDSVVIPNDPSVSYAISGIITSNLTVDNATVVMRLVKRLGIEFQTIAIRGAIKQRANLLEAAEIAQWLHESATAM